EPVAEAAAPRQREVEAVGEGDWQARRAEAEAEPHEPAPRFEEAEDEFADDLAEDRMRDLDDAEAGDEGPPRPRGRRDDRGGRGGDRGGDRGRRRRPG